MNGVAGKTSLDASGCLDAAVAWKSARVLHTNLVSPKALKLGDSSGIHERLAAPTRAIFFELVSGQRFALRYVTAC